MCNRPEATSSHALKDKCGCEPGANMGLSKITNLHDDSPMPIGKFKGKRLADVPEWWWSWFMVQSWCDKYPDLVQYGNYVLVDD